MNLKKRCYYHNIVVSNLINICTREKSTAKAVEYDDQKLELLGWFVDGEAQAFDAAVVAASVFLSIGSGAFSYVLFSPVSVCFYCTTDSVYIWSRLAIAEDSRRSWHIRVHML